MALESAGQWIRLPFPSGDFPVTDDGSDGVFVRSSGAVRLGVAPYLKFHPEDWQWFEDTERTTGALARAALRGEDLEVWLETAGDTFAQIHNRDSADPRDIRWRVGPDEIGFTLIEILKWSEGLR